MCKIKRIICDFDNTLALHDADNRNFSSFIPNEKLIEKLNKLYKEDWVIDIVTARGQLTCNEDSNLADKKYRKHIEDWLNANKVLYNSLSFQKKIAHYYIDDRGILPDDFINLKGV